MSRSPVTILPFAVLSDDPSAIAAIDDVFFASSNTKTFASAEARHAFRQTWLGRYLQHFPKCCFIAVDEAKRPVGYICGSLEDPARDPIFADQPHLQRFADVTPGYPAQLHVNLAETARGRGIGSRLIEAYVDHAAAAGCSGIHAISSRGARNLSFYAANDFSEIAAATIGDKELVFLGRKLR